MSLLGLGERGVASDYSNYAYKDFDVTTDENGGRAIAIAHNLARFDATCGVSRAANLSTPIYPVFN